MKTMQAAGTKEGKTAMVEDKKSMATNGRNRTYQLVTSLGTYTVKESFYESISAEQKLVVYYLSDGTTPLSLVTLDKEVHYLV